MNVVMKVVDFILHIDKYLKIIIPQYGAWTYGLLFLVIFMETGFVVTPFLPGDSLLFAAATFAAGTSSGKAVLNPWLLFILMTFAAFAGDTANYWIGHAIGAKAYTGEVKWIKKEYMDRTHAFFEKHGGRAIFLARFVPIIRTFTPFVAGVSEMPYGYFVKWNLIGGATWVATFTLLGYVFGNIPFVQKNFELVIVAIILISFVPVLVEAIKARNASKKNMVQPNS
jgi:membrane-associated protein